MVRAMEKASVEAARGEGKGESEGATVAQCASE
jgi:hypothetical protein